MFLFDNRDVKVIEDDVFIPISNNRYYLYYIIEPNVVVYFVEDKVDNIHCTKDFSKANLYLSSLTAKHISEQLQSVYDIVFSIGVK